MRAATIERWIPWLGVALFAASGIRVCDLLYGCGCTWAWAGAESRCNIHTPGVPHCPWCAAGTLGYAAVAIAIVAVELGVVHLARRRFGRRLGVTLAATAIGLVIGLLLVGYVAAKLGGYPKLVGLFV